MQATEAKLLTTAELARRLDVGQDKIRALAKAGRIPSVQVGANGRRFDWAEVMAALRAEAAAERQERAS
jgi:excisionase family DNA binding protein